MNAEEFFEEQEKKEKRQRRLRLLAIPLYYVIYITLLIVIWVAGNEFEWELLLGLLIPGIYYLMVFEAELLFEIKYGLNAEVQNAEPTDLFITMSRIGGYVWMIFGLLFVTVLTFLAL